MPYGSRSIFEATSVSGIIMSYDAFQTVINMGGELKNPRKNIVRGGIDLNVNYCGNLHYVASDVYWCS